LSITELVDEFGRTVEAQNFAIAKSNPKKGNELARLRAKIFDELRSKGDAGRDALATLLDDQRSDVRVMAASYLLRHCGQRAIDVLEQESKKSGIVAFGAQQALLRWKDGTWSLDPL